MVRAGGSASRIIGEQGMTDPGGGDGGSWEMSSGLAKVLFTGVTQQFQIHLFPGHTDSTERGHGRHRRRQVPHGYSRPDCLSHVEKSDVMEAAIHHVSIQNKHSNTFLGSSRQNSHRIGISVPSSQSQDIRNTCGVPNDHPRRVQCHY